MTVRAASDVSEGGRAGFTSRLPRLSPADRTALGIWLVSRCAVLALTWPAAYIMRGGAKNPQPWLSLWQNWDAVRLQAIAQYGYFGPAGHPLPDQVAFFPGFPIALAAVHLLARNWTVSGLLVSLLAGGVAAVALSRIAERHYQPGSGSRAVWFLVASPAAIFLAAGYTESLFLAAALTSWLAARDRRWAAAALLAGAACLIRVNGLFLCAALVTEILSRGKRDKLRALALLALALVPMACYELYLRVSTGSWLAWQHAEKAGWYRQLTNPVDTWRTAWRAGFGHQFAAPVSFPFQLEIAAVLAGIILTAVLLWRRRWPEAVYCGLTIGALATSVWYESVPRALLLLWPLWCGLAVIAGRRRWAGPLYLCLSVPVAAAIGILFLTGHWAG
jgi:Mannosyltransferase (PIG-V)